MPSHIPSLPALALAVLLLGAAPEAGLLAHGDDDDDAAERLAEGGRLYDKWWAEYGLKPPTETHPAYPARGGKSGATTWRCKECHGWDYRGRDGAYAGGSHYTGIKGIRRFDGGDPDRVYRILAGSPHHYDQVMLEPAIRKIAAFVVAGQVDMTAFIDPADKRALGDPIRGQQAYEDHCMRCHGVDGRHLNFSADSAQPEYLGTLARDNPWEALHKLRNGHPGSRMPMGPGMMGRWRPNETMPHHLTLSAEEQAAILAYTQTLPPE